MATNLLQALEGLPEERIHCAELALKALQNALLNWCVARDGLLDGGGLYRRTGGWWGDQRQNVGGVVCPRLYVNVESLGGRVPPVSTAHSGKEREGAR